MPGRVLTTVEGGVWEYSLRASLRNVSARCPRLAGRDGALSPRSRNDRQPAPFGGHAGASSYRLEWMSDFEVDWLPSAGWLGDLAADLSPTSCISMVMLMPVCALAVSGGGVSFLCLLMVAGSARWQPPRGGTATARASRLGC